MTADDVHISPRQSEGVHTIGLQTGHEVLVHQSAIDHRHHSEHICVGDTTATHHLRLDTEGFCHLCSFSSTTVHQYLPALNGAEVLKQL